MKQQEIQFRDQTANCAITAAGDDLTEILSAIGLSSGRPVMVLIGGVIYKENLDITRQAVQSVVAIAEELNAVLIAGGSEMGVMAEIGTERTQEQYTFPLLGVNIYDLVTYPGGPQSKKFLQWGKKRWNLSPHYTHYILVPGLEYGDESPILSEVASILSSGNRAVTVLMNGGYVSRIDIGLSLATERPIITVAGTGRYADELAAQNDSPELISVVSGDAKNTLKAAIVDRLQ
jgi:hypothetical protein